MVTRITLDKGRVPLQAGTVERLGPISADGQIPVWLLIIDPGHLRVLSQRDVPKFVDVEALNSADALLLETQEERERLAALRMRLLSTMIVPERRLKIPADAFDICGEYLDRAHVWVDQSPTRLEIYMASYIQRVLAIPASELLQKNFPIS